MKKDLIGIKTVSITVLLAIVVLTGCKEKTQANKTGADKTLPVTNINSAHSWYLDNLSFSKDFNKECRNYLALKSGKGGC